MSEPIPSVPRHLAGFLVDVKIADPDLTGDVQCLCGNRSLVLLCTGTRNTEEQFLEAKPIGDHFFYRWSYRCQICWREEVIFDHDLHGYSGFHAATDAAKSLPRPAMEIWDCHECGNAEHHVNLLVRLDIDAIDAGVAEEVWSDGYEWFELRTVCPECGHKNFAGASEG